jgi:hypothetical protein
MAQLSMIAISRYSRVIFQVLRVAIVARSDQRQSMYPRQKDYLTSISQSMLKSKARSMPAAANVIAQTSAMAG